MQIAIVGAGICGLYLALKLSKKNEVFLFEKKRKIGGKSCSAIFSERIFKFIPEAKNFIENKVDFCILHFPQKDIKLNFEKKFYVFDREKIEKFLFNSLKKSKNVKIFLKKRIREEDLTDFLERFDKIIGCDGANSIVRKFLKGKKPLFYLGIQGFLKEKDFSNFTEVWPTKEGFLWKIPRGKETEYGIIEKANRARRIFENFKKREKIEFERINSAPIPQGFFIPKNEKITLCGDAAGLVKPWSGGGVVWGLMAAKILIENFPDFLKYKEKVEKIFSFQIFITSQIKKIVYFFGKKFPRILPSKYKIDGDFIFPPKLNT